MNGLTNEDTHRVREIRERCNEPYALQDIPKLIYKQDAEFLLSLVDKLQQDTTLSRVQEYVRSLTAGQIGYGDDPAGFLFASHAAFRERANDAEAKLAAIRELCTALTSDLIIEPEWSGDNALIEIRRIWAILDGDRP